MRSFHLLLLTGVVAFTGISVFSACVGAEFTVAPPSEDGGTDGQGGCPCEDSGTAGGGGMDGAGENPDTQDASTAGSGGDSGAGGGGGECCPDAGPDSDGGSDASDGSSPHDGGSDADAGVVTCISGSSETPHAVTAQGGSSTSAYVHSYAEADQYSSSTPATLTLAGKTNPMQVVLSGFNGLSLVFDYGDAGAPTGEDFYKVNASLVAECTGVSYMSNACETKVARDFRCTYYPAEEAGGCSGITATFISLGKLTYYNASTGGYSKVIASIRCK